MKNYISKLSVAALATAMMLGMSGCSESTTDQVSDIVDIIDDGGVSYVGDRTLSGSVDKSALSAQDQAETRARSRRSSRADGDELVKLYVVDVNGSYVDTGIECTVTSGSYECPNIAGDQEYIVRYVQDLGDGRILEMSSSVSVGDTDPTAAETVVSPITTMVVETLVKAVQDAIEGVSADTDLIATIIENVKTAIVNTMNTLVQTGVIQIPSLVTDGNFTAIETSETVVELENDSLDDIAAVVTTNEEVAANIETVQNEAEASSFSALSDADKLKAVFDAIGWNDDMPAWVLQMFTAEYNNVQAGWTFGWLLANNAPFAVDSTEIDSYITDRLGVDAGTLAGYAATIATDINTSLNDGTIFDELKAQVVRYHTLKATDANLTEEDKAFLREFPSVVGEVFPADFANSMESNTTMQNMAQMFLVLGYTDMYDGVIGDRIREALLTQLSGIVTYEGEVENLVDELFDDMGGQFILEAYTLEDLAAYNYLYVGHGEARAENMWDDVSQTEVRYLMFVSMLSKLEWDLSENGDGMPEADANRTTAVLTYPKADGTTADVNLTYHQMDGHAFFGLMPYSWDYVTNMPIETGDPVISDFVTGDYTVTFTYENNVTNATETFTDTRSYYFIDDARDYRAELVSPEGQPQWQEEWNEWDFGALTVEQQAIIDEFNLAQMEYWSNGVQTFTPNTDTDADDVNDTLKGMVVKWKAPDVSALNLPDNVGIAYNVNVRLFAPTDTNGDGVANWEDCSNDWEACSKHIYSTWDDDKVITTTSLTLPVGLAVNNPLTPESNYELNVDVRFINKDTKREIAYGGWSNAQFRVGESLALSGNENISFNGTIEFSDWRVDSNETTLDTNATIALIGESWSETLTVDGYTTWETTRTVIATGEVNATHFSVDANWSAIEPHVGMNKNIQVVLFDDANGDGVWQDWDSVDDLGNYNGENSYWMYNSWMHIDTWGDTVIRTGNYNPETGEQTEDSVRLMQDTNATVDGLSIMIW